MVENDKTLMEIFNLVSEKIGLPPGDYIASARMDQFRCCVCGAPSVMIVSTHRIILLCINMGGGCENAQHLSLLEEQQGAG